VESVVLLFESNKKEKRGRGDAEWGGRNEFEEVVVVRKREIGVWELQWM